MKVVCFGQQNWDYCWTAKQQICVRLGGRGHPVLYVDPDSVEEPLGRVDTLRALAPVATEYGVREEAPGVRLYTHVHAPPLRWRLNEALRPRRLHGIADRLGMLEGVALAIHPAARRLMDAVRPAARVYYAVDEMTGFHGDPAVRRRMRREEELMIRACDAVIGVSPRLHERFAAMHPNAHLVQNAADLEHFEPDHLAAASLHPDLRAGRSPTIVLVGQIDERVDQGLLTHVARARPGWRIALAGRVKAAVDVSALEAEPNILLLGYQDYADLPSVLGAADVCIVPYHLTPLTHGCNPLKAWEYLATGRPVVATPLNALLPMDGLVTLAEGRDAFLGALDAAVADPARGREKRLAFVRRNGWDARVDQLEDIFADAVERAEARRGEAAPAVPGVTATAEDVAEEEITTRRRAAFRATRFVGRGYHALRRAGRALRRQPGPVRSILVARRSRLGDTVVLLPTLKALRKLYPGARIVLGVQKGFSAHFMVQGLVDEVRDIDLLENPSRVSGLRDMARLFAEGFDLVLCGASYFMLREAWLVGAPVIAGVDDGRPMQTLNDVRVRLLPGSHEVDNNLAIVEALGGDVAPEDRPPRLEPPADSAATALRVRQMLGVPADARIVVMHPGSQKPSRRWPADRFAALAARVLAERPALHVILTGVPDEVALVHGIRSALPEEVRPRAHDAVGGTTLEELLALLAHADAFVCNDTGTMHVARALGTPLLALLGPENDRRWGPYPGGDSPAIALRHEVPCAPCARWDCAPHFCLRELKVDEAAVALADLLDGRVASTDGVSLSRRAERLGWSDLHARGHTVPAVALVRLSGTYAGASTRHAEPAYPRLEHVAVSRQGGQAGTARAILDATDAGLIAIDRPNAAWDAADLATCVGSLVRDDDALAADPVAGGYRSIDAGAALDGGQVLMRRAVLERIAAQPGSAQPAAGAAVAVPDAVPR